MVIDDMRMLRRRALHSSLCTVSAVSSSRRTTSTPRVRRCPSTTQWRVASRWNFLVPFLYLEKTAYAMSITLA